MDGYGQRWRRNGGGREGFEFSETPAISSFFKRDSNFSTPDNTPALERLHWPFE